ncbi:hypothetical protein Tco_0292298 [Tanacetum coccineum]
MVTAGWRLLWCCGGCDDDIDGGDGLEVVWFGYGDGGAAVVVSVPLGVLRPNKRRYQIRIVIQRRAKDLQLGVKSYQKKLNLTKPDTFRSNLRNRTTYTAYSDPKGVIYKDQNNKNRLMRVGELHKFSDDTLDDVRSALNDIAKGIRMEYLPKRKWSGLDKRRARVMMQDIDQQLYERRLMRNLEKLVNGREYKNDLRLLERTI